MLKRGDTLTYVSLFSSAGVVKMEGFECIATNEIIGRRIEVQKANHKCRFDSGYVVGDISTDNVKARIYAEVDRWSKLGNDSAIWNELKG